MFAEFSLICIFHHVSKKNQIYGVHIPRKYIECMYFTHALVSHSKLQADFSENLFPTNRKGSRKL